MNRALFSRDPKGSAIPFGSRLNNCEIVKDNPMRYGMVALLLGSLLFAAPEPKTTLRFEVVCGPGLLAKPQDGRVLVVLSRSPSGEPRFSIGRVGNDSPPVLGKDADGFAAGKSATLDSSSAIFPIASVERLPRGTYSVQAVFDYNRDLRSHNAPDNLVSEPIKVSLDPAVGGTVKLVLTRKLPADAAPPNTAEIEYVRLRSEKLSKFHGRPIFLRAGVILPMGHAKETERRYPVRVRIGGYGQRYTDVKGMMDAESPFRVAWTAKDAPRMILVHLDGAGPLGDPYQVDSVNHGPYGSALTEELLPYIEKKYRGIGAGWARVVDGASTGGWVSLALQVFYPDTFSGCWSHCPDPVDFRCFELIDIYRDTNAFVNGYGNERPAARKIDGDTWYTMRHEVQGETVLGRGDNWAVSGKDWCAWNATFAPRGKDGLPAPLWDRAGKLDAQVVEHYRKYDLRAHLEKHWPALAPKLRGKISVWVGEADDYFLNNAVHLLDDWAKKAKPVCDARITFAPRQGHNWRGLTPKQMLAEMGEAVERGRKAAGR